MSRADERDPLEIDDYEPNGYIALTDESRWPGLSVAGAARLKELHDGALSPPWNHRTGHRLDAAGVERIQHPLPTDGWLEQHLAVARALPAYRGYPDPLDRLDQFPLVTREDLVADIAGFVPLDADLTHLLHGTSSGATGHALQIPDDVEDVARTFWLLVSLLESRGIQWSPESDRMALAYVVHQRQAYTYASVVPGFGDAGMARVNLNHGEWRQRDEFLLANDPQVFSGSPVSLAVLLEPQFVGRLHPLALVSGATHLSATLRADLEAAYACPVIDLYGLHETRPIGVSFDGGPFVVLDRRVHLECLDPAGNPVAEGQRGELVVTAGENPLLPLVRYRTGDFGRLVQVDGRLAIADLEGREDVLFEAPDGSEVPTVDLTQQLQAAGARGWTVVQHPDLTVTLTIVGGDAARIRDRFEIMLGPTAVTQVATLAELGEGKPRRYQRVR